VSVTNQKLKSLLRSSWRSTAAATCAIVSVFLVGSQVVLAEGTDILEPPVWVTIADGSKVIGAGIGLSQRQPGNIEIEIPAGVSVKQALLYWEGFDNDYAGAAPQIGVTTDIVNVSGFDIEGVFIGGPTYRQFRQHFAFRADITSLGLVSPGSNTLSVSGLDFGPTGVVNGAGVLVIVDDGSSSTLGVFDGSDFAYSNCTNGYAACIETVKRMFTFPAASTARDADLTMFFSSVSGTASSGDFRPSTVRIWVGGEPPIEIVNALDSIDGEEWDTLNIEFEVPAGVTYVEVQAFSEDIENTGNNPASFKWLAAALSVPDERGGGQGCTPGYWKQRHHFGDWIDPYDPDDLFSDHFEDAFPGRTLVQVLGGGGGGLHALGRHTVAALLNAANPEVGYDLTPQEVINEFNNVYPGSKDDYESLKDWFEDFNEQGCPLNNSDGSNSSAIPDGPPANSSSTGSATLPTSTASDATGGGGAFGIWEILALLLVGWLAFTRTHRQEFRVLLSLPFSPQWHHFGVLTVENDSE
jgi:hypothetical protein